MKKKIAIIGSRNITDYSILVDFIFKHLNINEIDSVISGGAKGVDSLAEQFANEFNLSTKIFIAEWTKYGKGAGFKRNNDIIINADIIFVLWDGKSAGTKHSIDLAKKYNKILYLKIIQ